MSYSVKNYKDHAELNTAIGEFLSDYITFKNDTTAGNSSSGMTHRYWYTINFGVFSHQIAFHIPEASTVGTARFGVSFVDSVTDTSKYGTLMVNPTCTPPMLNTLGLDVYMVSNGKTKFMAFGSMKSSILFDEWTSLDGITTKQVMISHLPRVGGSNTSLKNAIAYGNSVAIDFPKVMIESENNYECNIIPLHDITFTPMTSNLALCNTWSDSSIRDTNPIDTGKANYGFSSGYYITPFTLGGYKSDSLYVVDGGASIPPYGLIKLGKYTYTRITSNIFMRVGEA